MPSRSRAAASPRSARASTRRRGAPCAPTPGRMAVDRSNTIGLFLCGDVMTGRGVDQVLAHPVDPMLHEPCVRDAREYVALAERCNGPIPRPVDDGYVWGDALDELARAGTDARIVN